MLYYPWFIVIYRIVYQKHRIILGNMKSDLEHYHFLKNLIQWRRNWKKGPLFYPGGIARFLVLQVHPFSGRPWNSERYFCLQNAMGNFISLISNTAEEVAYIVITCHYLSVNSSHIVLIYRLVKTSISNYKLF